MKIQLQRCPFCGGMEFVEAKQHQAEAYVSGEALFGQRLNHTICRNCGSVVRSYVDDPEKLLKKKDRRIKE